MNTGFQYPAEYSLPSAKKMKLDNGIDLLQQHPELAYPNTDQQYATTASTTASTVLPEGVSQEEYLKAWEDYAKSYGYAYPTLAPQTTTSANTSTNEQNSTTETNQISSSAPSKEWVEVLDDETGATYYYNPQTGESSWGAAPNEEESETSNHDSTPDDRPS